MSVTTTWVMPVYNEIVELPECIESIKNQTVAPEEVIIIDDCSTDGTPEYIHNSFPDATLVRNESHVGMGIGRNLGVRMAVGDVIVMADTAIYRSDRNALVKSEFNKRPEIAASFAYGLVRRLEDPVDGLLNQSVPAWQAMDWDLKTNSCHIPLPGSAVRKEVMIKHPFSEESPHHELYQRVFYEIIKNYPVSYLRQNVVIWTRGTSKRNKVIANKIKDDFYASIGIKTYYSVA